MAPVPLSLIPATLHFPDKGWSSFSALAALPGGPRPQDTHSLCARRPARPAIGPAWDS